MPVVMYMEWDGVTPAQDDEARASWMGERCACRRDPSRPMVSWTGGLRVTDVWETGDEFQRFVDQRLMPAVQAIGIEGQPRADIRPLHSRVFAPAIEKTTIG